MSRWYGWIPEDILLRMSYEKAGYYWSRGWYAEKMQAIRIAGHIWGKDVDAELMDESPDSGYPETTYSAIGQFFGVNLEE